MAAEIVYETTDNGKSSTNENGVNTSMTFTRADDLRQEKFVPILHFKEDSIEYNDEHSHSVNSSISPSPSSGEETAEDGNSVMRHPRSFGKHHSSPRRPKRPSSYNLNSSNSKRKLLVQKQASERTVTFTDPGQEQTRQTPIPKSVAVKRNRFALKGRHQSFQVSSIRNLSGVRGCMVGSGVSKEVGYGQRLIEKDGRANILETDIDRVDLCSRYFSDLFTTLLDSSWCWVLLTTAAVYVGHWFIFGLFYWLFAVWNNDYEKHVLSESESSPETNASLHAAQEDPCVTEVYDGITAFLFSMESETTIGYGRRTITTACTAAVTCLTLQCIISAIFDTWVIGMCFAKFARPDARTNTTMFSRQAVICKRDGKRCLLVRFANLRKSLLLSVSVRARLITLRTAQSEEKNAGLQGMLEQRQVTFENESSALLTQPIEYRHVIDKDSPFYRIKPDLYNSVNDENYFELVFIVTGTLESTGLTMQAQTSFLSSEILYGYRFQTIISKSQHKYIVDFEHFHATIKEPLVKLHPEENKARIRDITAPLIEENETNHLIPSDEECSSEEVAHQKAESVL